MAATQDSIKTEQVLVRGTVAGIDADAVLTLLQALVGDYGHLGAFRTHERVFSSAGEKNLKWYPVHVTHRLRYSSGYPELFPYTIKYYGRPDPRQPLPCVKRPVLESNSVSDPVPLLKGMGCEFAFEYVRQGYSFRAHNLNVDFYEIQKLQTPGDPTRTVKLMGDEDEEDVVEELRGENLWILDVWSSSKDTRGPVSAADVQAFARMLHPRVVLRGAQS
ncbi:hypothetical protein FVE85_5388 [Porphyridium purpureum]|uniref:Mediator of RNA polymerase II transcription subunit 18 n=1 Tax=Porphyridium purpureum TaxID=35688 RepID=A0A5J4Z4A7_PORPP|nr:hypothetical protein FVE85_5388 [Porphyridium purpureum]|eukprot:POR9405..scf295_1